MQGWALMHSSKIGNDSLLLYSHGKERHSGEEQEENPNTGLVGLSSASQASGCRTCDAFGSWSVPAALRLEISTRHLPT